MAELRRRLLGSCIALLVVMLIGTVGYHALGKGAWDLGSCFYMTLITITTVGYGEVLPGLDQVPAARALTGILIVMGIGTFLYFASSLTALIVEGDLRQVLREKRMQKQIDALSGHVIVCGVGSTGGHVVRELVRSGLALVAIDNDADRLGAAVAVHPPGTVPHILGDGTDDGVLARAGVSRAKGLVAALHDDKDNLYAVVTAREANPLLRIVSRAIGVRAYDKLRKAGANAVVSPNQIGGTRMAAELIRPHVVEFMEEMLQERDENLRLEEVEIPEDSPLAGKTLRDTRIRDATDALVVAIRDNRKGSYVYNPGPGSVLEAGTHLIVMVRTTSREQLREGIARGFV